MRAFGILAACAMSGCWLLPTPAGVAHESGFVGWAQYRPPFLHPSGWGDDPGHDAPYGAFMLALATRCEVFDREHASPQRPVVVIVHGVDGSLDPWHATMPMLTRVRPGAMFAFRWRPFETRDSVVERLGMGMSALVDCFHDRASDFVVLAHSAGGVVASYAASRIAIPNTAPNARVRMITIASPLTGTNDRSGNEDGTQEVNLLLSLGTMIPGYRPAALGVDAVHLRTRFPADDVMEPTAEGRLPNDPSIGVPGAPHIDLPASVTHVGAIAWTVERLASGEWRTWFGE